MDNPWRSLPTEAPYIPEADALVIAAFNARAGTAHRIQTDVLPEPFIGRKDAPIVLLSLNPGFDEHAFQTYAEYAAREVWQRNVLHEPLDYPFYVLDPQFAESGAARWWKKKLKEPIQLAGEHAVANAILCIEYFPYPSRSFKAMPESLESQRYSFALAEQAMERNALIVLMRRKTLWECAVPRLKHYPRLFTLNSKLNPVISRNNCVAGFPHIAAILQGEAHAPV